jgi:hypothetical protein
VKTASSRRVIASEAVLAEVAPMESITVEEDTARRASPVRAEVQVAVCHSTTRETRNPHLNPRNATPGLR